MHRSSPLRSRRPGFTLRELSISMALGSVVMMTAVGMVHKSFDWSRTVAYRRSDDQTFFRLSRQLRDDIVVAGEVRLSGPDSENGEQLTLVRPDNTAVVYSIVDQSITRTESVDDDTTRHESFRWKHPRKMTLTHRGTDNRVRLEIRSDLPQIQEQIPLWRVVGATAGLRLRYQAGDIE